MMEPSARPFDELLEGKFRHGAMVSTYLNAPFLICRINRRLGGVPVGVNRDVAAHGMKIFCGGGSASRNLGTIGRTRALHCIRQDHRGVIAQRGHGIGRLVIFFLEVLHEGLHGLRRVFRRIMRRIIITLQGPRRRSVSARPIPSRRRRTGEP